MFRVMLFLLIGGSFMDNVKAAMRASRVAIYCNIILTVFKLFAGIVGNSTAMLADAMHSFSDMYTTFIVMIGIKMANRKADKDHPYGHERFECVAAILLSAVLLFTGVGIGWAGINRMISGNAEEIAVPGIIALVAALVTIVVKAVLYKYKRGVAKRINSSALMADAWHHLSDSLSSIGSFLGILGARLGFPMLDPLAAILICLFIIKAAADVFRDAIGKMTDKSCDEKTMGEMEETILAQEGVLNIDSLKTRLFGDRIYVEAEIGVESKETLQSAHSVAQCVHDAIEERFPMVKHCTVHVNPAENKEHRTNT